MRWAIAGLGYMGKKFIHDTKRLNDVVVTAVASQHESIPTGEEFKFYKNYSEMFFELNFDAVYIATTPNKHYNLLKMCLNARIPALCEKPIFFNKSEIDDFKNISIQSFVAENISFMFDKQIIELIGAINHGLFGEISEIRICLQRKLNPAARSRIMNRHLSKGALHDFGIYGIYFLTLISTHLTVMNQKIDYESENDFSGEVTFLANNLTNCKLIYSIEDDLQNSILILGSITRVEILDFLTPNQSIYIRGDSSKILTLTKEDKYFSNLTRSVAHISTEISENLLQSKFVPLNNSIRTADLIVEILGRGK